ncbi:MAG: VanZ family protein [Clostridiaceae bacterium]|nr:VanZ family protein [Clostridiaceae bacterium]
MTKANQMLIVLIFILLLTTIAFIWSNSLQSIPESQERSLGVMDKITSVLEVFVGKGNVTDHLVRKLAHFTEFSALGCELALLAVLRKSVRLQPFINCLFIGLAVAVIDETIQIFSNRGSQVSDVLLDFSGSVTGIVFVLLIRWLVLAIRRKRGRVI